MLAVVALGQWQARALVTSWETPLWVVLHPLAADGSDAAAHDVATLDAERFAPLEASFALDGDGLPADVRLAVRYFDPERNPRLPHSLGLAEARVGIVNAFADADYRGSNRVVIAHELLHTLGARDKYDPASNLPSYPDGYAEPAREPRHPQLQAELMGGRIPLGDGTARMPAGLDEVVVGEVSAREIRWTQ